MKRGHRWRWWLVSFSVVVGLVAGALWYINGPSGSGSRSMQELFPDEALRGCVARHLPESDDAQVSSSALNSIVKLDCSMASYRSKSAIRGLSGIEHLANVEEVWVSGSTFDSSGEPPEKFASIDLTPLTKLTNLRELSLGQMVIPSPDQLAKFEDLDLLSLSEITSDKPITDLGFLKNYKKLTHLFLFSMESIDSLAGVETATNLKVLWLQQPSRVTSIEPLRPLDKLEELSIGSTDVVDFGPLAGKQRFRDVSLPGTVDSDYSPLRSCPSLEKLFLSRFDKHQPPPVIEGVEVTVPN